MRKTCTTIFLASFMIFTLLCNSIVTDASAETVLEDNVPRVGMSTAEINIMKEREIEKPTEPYTVKGVTYYQTYARTVLMPAIQAYINDSDNRWYYKGGDINTPGTKTDLALEQITQWEYDTELEKCAMLRAAECLLFQDHTRLSDQMASTVTYGTAYEDSYYQSECLSPLNDCSVISEVTAAFLKGQMEENETTQAAQAHRCAWLGVGLGFSEISRVGLGLACIDGKNWICVAVFASPRRFNAYDVYADLIPLHTDDPAFDGTKDVIVDIYPHHFASNRWGANPAEEDIDHLSRLKVGDEVIISDMTVRFISSYRPFMPASELTWVSNDESVVKVEDGVIKAVGEGETALTVSAPDTPLREVQPGSVQVKVASAIVNPVTYYDEDAGVWKTVSQEEYDAYLTGKQKGSGNGSGTEQASDNAGTNTDQKSDNSNENDNHDSAKGDTSDDGSKAQDTKETTKKTLPVGTLFQSSDMIYKVNGEKYGFLTEY